MKYAEKSRLRLNPFHYDKDSARFQQGAFKNQRGEKSTNMDRTLLGSRQTNYHRFV